MEHRLYGAQASVVVTHGLSSLGSWTLEHRLNSCGTQAMLDLLSPDVDPMSPALAGGCFTTEPLGKPRYSYLFGCAGS